MEVSLLECKKKKAKWLNERGLWREWKEQKKIQALARKREARLRETEEAIASCEERNREIDDLLSKEEVYTDMEQVTKLALEKEQMEEKLGTLYDEWAALAEQ